MRQFAFGKKLALDAEFLFDDFYFLYDGMFAEVLAADATDEEKVRAAKRDKILHDSVQKYRDRNIGIAVSLKTDPETNALVRTILKQYGPVSVILIVWS